VSQGNVLELVLHNPPVNALAGKLRPDLAAAVLADQHDPDVRTIIIRGS